MGIQLRVWGDFACFTRPEMKAERVSYDVITPSAARGILEALYWKPQIVWRIHRLHVLTPIRFTNLRRNEVGCKISKTKAQQAMKAGRGSLGIVVEDERQQRAATLLRDVDYLIEATFDVIGGEDPPAKHLEMFKRRARNGQCFHHPYLGCREFDAHFELHEGPPPATAIPPEEQDRDLGWMPHDIDYDNDMSPRFFNAKMRGGIVEVPPFRSEEVKG